VPFEVGQDLGQEFDGRAGASLALARRWQESLASRRLLGLGIHVRCTAMKSGQSRIYSNMGW
jgi:hypothetical protein